MNRVDLRQFVSAVSRRWWVVVLSVVVGSLGAAAVTLSISPTYESQTRIYVASTGTTALDTFQLGAYTAQRVQSYANLADDPSFLRKVAARAQVSLSSDDLTSKINTEAIAGTIVLLVTVRDDQPERAQVIARATGEELVTLVQRLEEAPPEDGQSMPDAVTARVAGDASLNPDPVAPNLPINVAIGLMLGLLVGVATAVSRELFDTAIRSSDQLAEASGGAPVLATVPRDSKVAAHPLISDPDGPPERREAFKVLRSNLQFVSIDESHRVLLVTSALPDEGKTLTSTNLALALVQTGRRVLLIDCDLRKPSLATVFGAEPAVGLLTALMGRLDADACVQGMEPGLDLLTTGPLPPNPAEVLETTHMKELIDRFRDQYDTIILDAPPLLPVADPAALAHLADGVLLVVRHGKTDRALVEESVERIDRAGGTLIGCVLNMTPSRRRGYGYGYGYGESAAPLSVGRHRPTESKMTSAEVS